MPFIFKALPNRQGKSFLSPQSRAISSSGTLPSARKVSMAPSSHTAISSAASGA